VGILEGRVEGWSVGQKEGWREGNIVGCCDG